MSLNDYSISEYRDAEFFKQVFPLKKKVSNVASDSAFETVNLLASSYDVRVIVTESRISKRCRIETDFRPNFVSVFLVETLDNLDIDVIIEEFVSYFFIDEDPKTYEEVVRSIDAIFWKEAIKSEIDSLESNKT